MSEFDALSGLLDKVLAGEDPEGTPEPKTDGKTIDIPSDIPQQEPEALSTPDPEPDPEPEQEPDPIDEIDALIADATGENEPDPEPESPEPEDPLVEAARNAEALNEPIEVTQVCDTQTEPVFAKGAGDEAVPMPEFTSEEIMDSLDIRNFGSLVTLRTKRWHAKIKDRRAAKDAAKQSGADSEAFEAYKKLLAGADEKLKRVHKAIDAARTAHYAMTLPWSVVAANETGKRTGPRLLPNSLFMEYTTAVGKAKQETTDALNEFEAAYPSLIQIAQQKLGSAFNQGDYPPIETIKSYFDLSFDFTPIPKGQDFDGLQAQQVTKLADALNRKTRTMLENAMQEAWTRLYESVQHAHARLSNPDAMFHYTLIDKLREQATMLSHLNATKDPGIEEVRAAVDKRLTKFDVKDIRKDDALRKSLADDAKVILDRMQEIADAG